jgi:hypothetical protein
MQAAMAASSSSAGLSASARPLRVSIDDQLGVLALHRAALGIHASGGDVVFQHRFSFVLTP